MSESTAATNSSIPFTDRLRNAAFANVYYLKSFLFPGNHSAFHPYSMVHSLNPVLTGLTAIVLCGSMVAAFLKKRLIVFFGLGFYLATVALVLQLIPVGSAIVAERYSYLPYLGLGLVLGFILDKVGDRAGKILTLLGLIALGGYYGHKTFIQSNMWQDHTTLFSQAANHYPEDPFIRKTLSSGYWKDGNIDSAKHHITYAIDHLGLVTSSAFELLANCYSEEGQSQEALAFFNESIAIDSNNVTARYHRGLELLDMDPVKAISDFEFCERSSNDYVRTLIYTPRGRAYGFIGQYDLALEDFNKVIELFPQDSNAILDRAVTYERLGKLVLAYKDYEQVLEIDGDNQYANSRMVLLKESISLI